MHRYLLLGLSGLVSVLLFATLSQGQMFVFPEKGQSPDQQELDEFSCYKWAKTQTGFDPNQPVQSPTSHSSRRKGGALSGAMGGAALGAIGGAIAGNAGKGAAIGAGVGGAGGMLSKRRAQEKDDKKQQQALAGQEQNRETFNRAYKVCLEAKGYKVG